VLLITEHTHVVDQLETLSGFAVGTCIWLLDLTHHYIHILRLMALVALEVGFLHFRNNIRVSDNDTLDSH